MVTLSARLIGQYNNVLSFDCDEEVYEQFVDILTKHNVWYALEYITEGRYRVYLRAHQIDNAIEALREYHIDPQFFEKEQELRRYYCGGDYI